jgi:gliding motility-associated-like protein
MQAAHGHNSHGAAAGTYTFEYRVTGTAPCADATAVVTVNVVAAPNAGTDNTVSACNNNSAFDLFASLGGTPDAGGTWTQLTGSALTITGNNVDLTSATAGTYTFEYRVTATAPCVDAIAVITLNVDDKPDDTLPLSATIDPVCSGGSSAITVSNSESGVSYVLRNNADNSVIGTAVAGNGLAIDLPTGTLTATTTFNVLAVRGACAIPINSTVTITVLSAVDPALSATAQASAVCEGTGTSIDIANSQIGVNYQLRNDADDSPIGAAVAGTGGTISLPTGNLSATTTFNILGSNAACSAELSTLVTVNVDFSPDAAKTLTAAISPLCGGASTTITVSNSQAGVNYQLRNDADDSLIGSPVAGTGGNIALSTGALTATTTFNVIALNGSCPPVELNTTVTVAVGGTIDLTLAVTPNPATLCSGSSADVRITSSETGVDYQLIDDSDNSLIGGVVAGTGGDILLPTGNLTISKTFRVLGVSGSCSAELNNTASITVDAAPDLSLAVNADATNLCSGNSTFVHVDNSEPGIVYQLRDDTDNSNVSGAVIGNGATINLPTGPIAATRTFHVLATNGGCSAKLTTTITVTIDPAPIDLVPVAQNSSVCPGNGTFVQINNSEPGITYQLRDDSDNSAVSGAAIGNGGTINLATGAITGSRTFNVLATTPKCSLQLSTKVTITVLAANDPACSNCSTVTIQTINAIKVTCNVDVPDGSIEFEIIPPVPVINISGVKIDITGPTSKSQTDNFIFTGLAAGNYNYTVTYGDPANPACIKTGTFIIEAVRMPDPVTFDLTVTDFDCLTEFGTITLSNIQGAPNTEFKYVLNADGVTLRQGTITPAQAASPVTIGNILLGEYEIILNQDQQPENGCVGLVYSTPAAFNIEQPGVGCDIYIPNIFTPNGDGFNDTFVIKHLPPNAILKITNRWGKEVYSSDDYQNDWTGGDVSDGIYYYRLVVEGKSINGWVEILR